MRVKIYLLCLFLLLVVNITAMASNDLNLAKIEAGGQRILNIVRTIGFWLILIKAIAEVVKAGLNGDRNAITQIIITYVLIYASLFFLPWALRLVEEIFK